MKKNYDFSFKQESNKSLFEVKTSSENFYTSMNKTLLDNINMKEQHDLQQQSLVFYQNMLFENRRSVILLYNELEKIRFSKDKDASIISEKQKTLKNSSYDVVIDFESFLYLNKGFEIKIEEAAYNELKDHAKSRIGILGNYKIGKTFLISKLLDRDFTEGFNIDTMGLSIFVHKDQAFIDSAGLNKPFPGDCETEYDSEQQLFDRAYYDKIMIEYITSNSDVVILVIGMLTYNDQLLIDNIIKLIRGMQKELLIIHNLHTLKNNTDLKEYVKTDLKRLFKLDSKVYSCNEKSLNFRVLDSNQSVYHYIVGNFNDKSFEEQNKATIEEMLNRTSSVTEKNTFDPVSTFTELLKNYISVAFKDVKAEDLVNDTNLCGLFKYEKLNLKEVFVFNHLVKDGDEITNYRICQDQENKFLIVMLEVADPDLDKIVSTVTEERGKVKFSIKGGKNLLEGTMKIIEENITNSFSFEFTIPFPATSLKNEKPQIEYKNGSLFLYYHYLG
jgi:hypothetical protein